MRQIEAERRQQRVEDAYRSKLRIAKKVQVIYERVVTNIRRLKDREKGKKELEKAKRCL